MSTEFSPSRARGVYANYRQHLAFIDDTLDRSQRYLEEVGRAADQIAARAVLDHLQTIAVEELNRDKRGLRVSLLRNNGYETLADLVGVSAENLCAIRGIGIDSAIEIVSLTEDLAAQLHKDTRIKLNADRKTPDSASLMVAIQKYRRFEQEIASSLNLLQSYRRTLRPCLEQLTPTRSTWRWWFAARSTKNDARSAYAQLIELENSGIQPRLMSLYDAIKDIDVIPEEAAWAAFAAAPISFTNVLEKIRPGLVGQSDGTYGLSPELARTVQQEAFFPDGLLCSLRPYQEWGVKYILNQERVLLGDEMGLGKTIQAIATMVSLRNTGATHFLVVCPASVTENWCREVRKHSKLTVVKIHGSSADFACKQWQEHGGVAVTTYETTANLWLDAGFRLSLLIADEAHYVKNPEAKRTINVRRLIDQSQRVLFMTGTALENHPGEMINLIGMLKPKVARRVSALTGLSFAPQFRERIASVYYRRKREDVLTELPELVEIEQWCVMSPEETEAYEHSVLTRQYQRLRQVSWNLEDLRYSSKALRLRELVAEASAEDRKVIVFSYFLNTIRAVERVLPNHCTEPITGSVSAQRRQQIIDEFDEAPAGTVLLAQIQAGGTGLNIQSASMVILCEPQIKPSIEEQAISRAYRMGQTRNVLVYRLLCEESIDERICEILAKKRQLFDAFADESIAAQQTTGIDESTMGNLIEAEIDRINAKKASA